ncbi:sugar transferase [Roseivirga sp.]|uniref:sugar transferase n=1 Tax=Roseivirga sp. TaxID=1964215 RepID=UPI003B524786
MNLYSKFFKRLIDLILSLILFLLSSPLFIIVSILLFFSNSGSPYFLQRRPGKRGRMFSIFKFKTMNDSRDEFGELLPDKDRITVVGKYVRSLSLDEIPQILNVILGQMSLVGPRPLLEEYLPLYTESQRRRHEVKPGITGWAQVNGRNNLDWETKFDLDIWYVDNLSFMLDLKILWLTLIKVVKSEGINKYGEIGMTKFSGSKAKSD